MANDSIERVERELRELRQVHAELQRGYQEARKDAERAQDSAEHFRQIFHLSPMMMVILAFPERTIFDINAAGLEVFGFERDEVIGRSPKELLVWEDPSVGDMTFELLKKTGELKDIEARLRRRDGSIITVLFYARLVVLGGRSYSLACIKDITARKQAEATLRE